MPINQKINAQRTESSRVVHLESREHGSSNSKKKMELPSDATINCEKPLASTRTKPRCTRSSYIPKKLELQCGDVSRPLAIRSKLPLKLPAIASSISLIRQRPRLPTDQSRPRMGRRCEDLCEEGAGATGVAPVGSCDGPSPSHGCSKCSQSEAEPPSLLMGAARRRGAIGATIIAAKASNHLRGVTEERSAKTRRRGTKWINDWRRSLNVRGFRDMRCTAAGSAQ